MTKEDAVKMIDGLYARRMAGNSRSSEQEAQEQREKTELKLQVRLVAAGAVSYSVEGDDDIEALYGVECRINFTNAILSEFNVRSSKNFRNKVSINTMTEYMFSKGIRAIRPE